MTEYGRNYRQNQKGNEQWLIELIEHISRHSEWKEGWGRDQRGENCRENSPFSQWLPNDVRISALISNLLIVVWEKKDMNHNRKFWWRSTIGHIKLELNSDNHTCHTCIVYKLALIFKIGVIYVEIDANMKIIAYKKPIRRQESHFNME